MPTPTCTPKPYQYPTCSIAQDNKKEEIELQKEIIIMINPKNETIHFYLVFIYSHFILFSLLIWFVFFFFFFLRNLSWDGILNVGNDFIHADARFRFGMLFFLHPRSERSMHVKRPTSNGNFHICGCYSRMFVRFRSEYWISQADV